LYDISNLLLFFIAKHCRSTFQLQGGITELKIEIIIFFHVETVLTGVGNPILTLKSS
jgi:hypothetical protein